MFQASGNIYRATRIKTGLQQAAIALAFAGFTALIVALAIREPMYTLGVVYALVFWGVAWKRPDIAMLLIVAASPFQTDVSGGSGLAKFSIAEVNLALTVPVYVAHIIMRKRLPAFGPMALPVFAYFAVCAYSSAINWHPNSAPLSLLQMAECFFVIVTIFATFSYRTMTLTKCLYAYVIVCTFLSVAGMATNYGCFELNKNGIGSTLSCGLLVAVELWLAAAASDGAIRARTLTRNCLIFAVAVISIGLIFSLSRGSWLGALAGLIVLLLMRRQGRALARTLAVLAPLVAICWFAMPSESQHYATNFDRSAYNIQARYNSIDIAESEFDQSPVYGMGVGLRKEYDATDLVWLTLAETGWLGLATLSLVFIVLYSMLLRTNRILPPADARRSFVLAAAALTTCQLTHGMVDHYWSRGAMTVAWACVGIALGASIEMRGLHATRPFRAAMPTAEAQP